MNLTEQEQKIKEQELEIKRLQVEQQLAKLNIPTTETPITPPTPPPIQTAPTIKEPTNDKITKRQAAIECINIHKQKKIVAITAAGGGFVTALTMVFNPGIGAIIAGVISIVGAFFIIKGEQESKRLQTTYNINLKGLK